MDGPDLVLVNVFMYLLCTWLKPGSVRFVNGTPIMLQPRTFLPFHFFRYFWDLSIDTVAVINLVLAVGLSVDYAAHVGHSFMIKSGSKDERMVQVRYW